MNYALTLTNNEIEAKIAALEAMKPDDIIDRLAHEYELQELRKARGKAPGDNVALLGFPPVLGENPKRILNPVESGVATIIARQERNPGKVIVLAFLGLDHPTPYAVWREVPDGPGHVIYLSGDYIRDITDAVARFMCR